MIEDMRMRKLELRTREAYVRAVRKLAKYLGRAPDTATAEELRNFQLHLVDHGVSPITLNATITGLKFFFEVTVDHGEVMAKMQPVHVPRTLPVVLSREEVGRLIAAAGNLKHQTALAVAYGAGLRASEVTALKVGDIDSERMTLRVEHLPRPWVGVAPDAGGTPQSGADQGHVCRRTVPHGGAGRACASLRCLRHGGGQLSAVSSLGACATPASTCVASRAPSR